VTGNNLTQFLSGYIGHGHQASPSYPKRKGNWRRGTLNLWLIDRSILGAGRGSNTTTGDAGGGNDGDHKEDGGRLLLGLGFGFQFFLGFFPCGRHKPPASENWIFACGSRRAGDPHAKTLFDHTEKSF
jgi:hypothetical protein